MDSYKPDLILKKCSVIAKFQGFCFLGELGITPLPLSYSPGSHQEILTRSSTMRYIQPLPFKTVVFRRGLTGFFWLALTFYHLASDS